MNSAQRVLLIDDDMATVRMMELALKLEGYEIQVSSTREDALPLVDTWSPGLIVMDYLGVGLDPETFLAQLREKPFTGSVLLCTASDQELHLPVDGVLRKPFDPDELLKQVRTLTEPGRN